MDKVTTRSSHACGSRWPEALAHAGTGANACLLINIAGASSSLTTIASGPPRRRRARPDPIREYQGGPRVHDDWWRVPAGRAVLRVGGCQWVGAW
jgi:hypothetical protein